MIPTSAADLETLVAEARRQTEEVVAHFGDLSEEEARWRPSPEKWSMAGHLAHMAIVNGPYLDTIETEVARARERGQPLGEGPYRHPRIATWFARSMEPPPKRRWKTFRSMVPDPDAGGEDAVARFAASQERLVAALESARGVDLGRLRFGSPHMAVLRLSLGTAFASVLGHNRRHVWLIHEVNRSLPRG